MTGVRAVLAWWVVTFHLARELLPLELLRRIAGAGHVAVDVFFVLSGYVLAKRYIGVGLGERVARHDFWVRRFARIYPIYFLSLSVGFIAAWPRSGAALATGRGAVRAVAQLVLANAWWHPAMFAHNWAAWSLSVEAFFYVLFPLLLVRLTRIPRRARLAVIALCWAATFIAPSLYSVVDPDNLGRPLILGDDALWAWYLKFFPVQRLPELVAGALAALARAERGPFRAPPLIGGASFVAIVALSSWSGIPFAFRHSGVLLPVIVIGIMALDHERPSWLGRRWPVALGRASYVTYAMHVPLFLLLAHVDARLWERGSWVAAYAALLLATSLVVHATIEEPLRRKLTRRFVWGGRYPPQLAPSVNTSSPAVPRSATK